MYVWSNNCDMLLMQAYPEIKVIMQYLTLTLYLQPYIYNI